MTNGRRLYERATVATGGLAPFSDAEGEIRRGMEVVEFAQSGLSPAQGWRLPAGEVTPGA
jgi:hypothetical protein